MGFVLSQVVTDPGLLTVEVGTTQLLFRNDLTSCSLDEGRTTKEHSGLVLDHNDLIRHGRNICPASSATAHHHCDLRDSCSRHLGLIVENSSKMVTVREYVILLGQESTG
jgi:hypothetical protein